MSATVTAIKWKYNQKRDLTYPIKIRVTCKTESKYYPIEYKGTNLSLTESDWITIETNPQAVKGELKRIRDHIRKCETDARQVCNDITLSGKRPFSFNNFEKSYRGQSQYRFMAIFDSYLKGLLEEGRTGTYRTYKCARVAFHNFLGKDIEVHDLTQSTLKAFEDYLIKERGTNKNTVAIYMRTLKVIYNVAASDNPYLLEFYPFARKRNDKNRYQIRTAAGKKGQALSMEDLKRFIQIELIKGTQEWTARQLWMFSFYCQGMNFRDIAMLKIENYHDTHITYIRNKTKNTETHDSPINVAVTAPVKAIIEELSTGKLPHDYLFDILKDKMTPIEVENTVMQTIKTVNKYLKRICEKNGLPSLTTYWARHTYASLLKYNGVSVDYIKDLLGHSSVRTTQTYLKSLEVSQTTKINEDLQKLIHAV